MSESIRPSQPSDVEAALPLIYSSGPAAFDYVCIAKARGDVFDFLRHSFVNDLGELGFSHHRSVIVDGEVVGIGAQFSGDAGLKFLVSGMRAVFGAYGFRNGLGVIGRALKFEKVVEPPKGKLHYVAHLGVAPEMRSRGLGQKLVQHLLDEGKALGRTQAGLDVSVENPRARELYLRMGFKDVVEHTSTLRNEHAIVPSHIRMERAI